MDIGIFAKTFQRDSLDEILQALIAHGLTVTQFNMACVGDSAMPATIDSALTVQIRRLFEHYRVQMVAVSGTFNMIHPDQAVVDGGMGRLETLAATAHDMGTNLITLCTGTRHPIDQWQYHPDNELDSSWEAMLLSMERALAIAEKYDVYLGIEPEKANVVSSAAKARQLLDHFGSKRLKIVMDAANLFEKEPVEQARLIVEEAFSLLCDDIVIAHAKDRDAQGEFVAAGEGVLDYDHYIAQLQKVGFSGPLILHGLSEAQVPYCVAFLRQRML